MTKEATGQSGDFAFKQRESGKKTELVTANMDVFFEIVAPSHDLDSVFDIILNTSDNRTLDKSIFWRKAYNTFGPDFAFSTSVLIDDSPKMVSLFRSLGGHIKMKETMPFRRGLTQLRNNDS